MTKRHELTDDQWELIRDLVDTEWKGDGRPPKPRRPIVNGIFFVLKTGIQWRDLPDRFGKWKTVYHYFRAWSIDGTFDAMLRRLVGALARIEELDDDLWCVDGTIVRAARCAAGAKKGGPMPTMQANRRWAAPAGDLARRSTSCATATATASPRS